MAKNKQKEDSIDEKDIVGTPDAPEVVTEIDAEGEFEEFGDNEKESDDDSEDY
jgi:hypothetical protein